MGNKRNADMIYWESQKERVQYEDLHVQERVILKSTLEK
jgi:hypothetical protein